LANRGGETEEGNLKHKYDKADGKKNKKQCPSLCRPGIFAEYAFKPARARGNLSAEK